MKRQKIRGLEDWKICNNDKKQEMKNNGNIDSVSERYRSHGKTGNDKTTGCPTKAFGHDRRCGFTLVELVIVIAIVIILSVISVPIYRGYVDKAKMAEGYALLGQILSAQKAYYSEYGNFLRRIESSGKSNNNYYTCNETVLGIDARGNKYFTWFHIGDEAAYRVGFYFHAEAQKPVELQSSGYRLLLLQYNIYKGSRMADYNGNWSGKEDAWL